MPVGLWAIVLALGMVPGELIANPAGMLVMASVLAAGLVVIVAARIEPPTSPVRILALALRERSRRTAFLPLRDPDAPGRSRPRAPGH
ncbi:DUF6412 domain-containing protein [Amycolatopsis taiwanensis]|uniref:Uncharacterized protein n=1 Tax=Amycolatopsis taiwanensis TaxID=342230 RepID=A0A9W6R8T6_9PSEU|nr:DUF6412 domain-containing protein [Amycolatopsis taiwanensis]GLY71464.1 hypothetical protein Atai01_80830 [Amycolatopsis taiwanensis]